jgi:hypothetical protein
VSPEEQAKAQTAQPPVWLRLHMYFLLFGHPGSISRRDKSILRLERFL